MKEVQEVNETDGESSKLEQVDVEGESVAVGVVGEFQITDTPGRVRNVSEWATRELKVEDAENGKAGTFEQIRQL